MLSLYNKRLMLDAFKAPLPPGLRGLLRDRLDDMIACGLEDLTHILVIELGDTEAQIEQEIGFSPLVDRLDGFRYGEPAWQPGWDWHERHDGWWELIFTVANSGFAYVLLIQDADGIDPLLHDMCQRHASRPR